MSENYDLYNGVKVVKGWGKEIEFAQTRPQTKINGIIIDRVLFGNESSNLETDTVCSDCAVLKGQLHVMGCNNEQCPICGGSFLYCDCDNEENI